MNISVLLPLVFPDPFDYRVPEGMTLAPGDYVRVPFGRRSIWGIVWGEGIGEIEEKKIKQIETRAAHLPPMSAAMRTFIDWVAWYTLAPRGLVLKMALPVAEALEPPKEETRYILGVQGVKLTPSRLRIVTYLSDGIARTAKEITLHAKVSATLVREFAKAGGLIETEPEKHTIHLPNPRSPTPDPRPLTPNQAVAAANLRDKLAGHFSVTLIDGVTGSGKTEVYFDAIAACLVAGKQALVLLPEIALSVQWLARFKARFGFSPVTWHSGISPAAKRDAWRHIATGDVPVVVGARSALFLPFARLALIVVDEEHDASYKQEDGVIYHARDMAVARARHEKIPATLVSATPSLETEYNVMHGRYGRVHLPTRHGEAEMPQVKLIDMRLHSLPSGSWLSEPLKAALINTLAQGSQAMLFMNRRGYAPLMLCRSCGHRFICPHCAAYLILHRARNRLLCHHCGHAAFVPKTCPQCRQENNLIPFGPGVERIAEETRALLPEARIAVMTSDEIDTPAKADAVVTAMMNGGIDILIGTQMVAKGHHFAGLALVGVLDADMGLGGGDLRAGERTYQLLHQVAGRAGREKIKGEVWLQTYMPEHPVMQALRAGDRDAFMGLEARMRQEALMPPYGKLAAIIIEGKDEKETSEFARALVKGDGRGATGESVLASSSPLILGPAPAPLHLLRGKYRFRILVKAAKDFALQDWLSRWVGARKIPASLRVKIDIEPYSFL